MVENVVETSERIEYSIILEQYLQFLEGTGRLSVTVVLDLNSPRWKPSKGGNDQGEGKRRAPWVKTGTFVSVMGKLNRVKRDEKGLIISFEVAAETVLIAGRASLLATSTASPDLNSEFLTSPHLNPEAQ